MDHIEANLGQDLRLAELAEVAQFSPFHFHRIFSAITGETLATFTNRVRLERAAQLLSQESTAVSEIARECGFATASAFSRAFRAEFTVTPSKWRSGLGHRAPICAATSLGQPPAISTDPLDDTKPFSPAAAMSGSKPDEPQGCRVTELPQVAGRHSWTIDVLGLTQATVTIEHLESADVIYARHTGAYAGDGELFVELFVKLGAWADHASIPESQRRFMTLFHDSPSVTDESQLRVSACLKTTPPFAATGFAAGSAPTGDLGRLKIDGGIFAIARFELADSQYSEAWSALLGGWLPVSGYEVERGNHFERYPAQRALQRGRQVVEICLPVRRLPPFH